MTGELSLVEPPEASDLARQVSAMTRTWPLGEPPADAWRRLGRDLGLAGLLVPGRYDGAGAGPREMVAAATAVGRHLAAVPFVTSAVTATAVLAAVAGLTGRDEAGDLLRALVRTDAVAALAVPATTPADHVTGLPADGRPDPGAEVRVSARIRGVLGAERATHLLVPLEDGHGGFAIGVTPVDERVAVVAETSMDETRPVATVTLDEAAVTVLAADDRSRAVMRRALQLAAVAVAAEQVGATEWAIESDVRHLTDRRQFGRQLGSFQALRHSVARTWVELQQARAVLLHAAAAHAEPDLHADEVELATALASVHCRTVALRAVEDALQVHGGIGFTWEHPLHRQLKRALAALAVHGTPDHHRRIVARLADLPGPTDGGDHG